MSFDVTTAYASEYTHLDGVLDATLVARDAEGNDLSLDQSVKIRETDITQTAFSGSASDLGFRASTTVMELWQLDPAKTPPQNGYTIRDAAGVNWAIHSVRKRLYGPMYECLVSMVGETGAGDEL